MSLLEDAPVTAMKQYALSSSGSGGMRNKNDSSDHWNGLPIEDDTIVMIDRLQDITKKALNLQVNPCSIIPSLNDN